MADDARNPPLRSGDPVPALAPCPFCGSAARLVEAEPSAWCVECEGCQASSGLRYSLKEDARPLVAEQWNLRSLARPVDALSGGAEEKSDEHP